jgi:hypothetical protein
MHYLSFFQDLSSAWLLTGISPHLFDRLRLCIFQTWSVPSKQNLILKQAFPFHPHPPTIQATTKSNLVRLSEE